MPTLLLSAPLEAWRPNDPSVSGSDWGSDTKIKDSGRGFLVVDGVALPVCLQGQQYQGAVRCPMPYTHRVSSTSEAATRAELSFLHASGSALLGLLNVGPLCQVLRTPQCLCELRTISSVSSFLYQLARVDFCGLQIRNPHKHCP